MTRAFLTKTQLLAALQAGHRLEAGPRTSRAGEPVEYVPRRDEANNHPDFYPWRIVGRSDCDRLRCAEVVVVDGAAS